MVNWRLYNISRCECEWLFVSVYCPCYTLSPYVSWLTNFTPGSRYSNHALLKTVAKPIFHLATLSAFAGCDLRRHQFLKGQRWWDSADGVRETHLPICWCQSGKLASCRILHRRRSSVWFKLCIDWCLGPSDLIPVTWSQWPDPSGYGQRRLKPQQTNTRFPVRLFA